MKYAIAITNRVLDRFGEDVGLAYDIMCAFIKTLHNSSLSDKVKKNRLIGVVPAFHGHVHNRKCQVHWHPMFIEGAGTEDFKECERTFCGSNNLANVTRLATPFHRRQEILEYFQFHDLDKHISIGISFAHFPASNQEQFVGRFFFQNYRDALDRIKHGELELAAKLRILKTTATQLEQNLEEERKYLDRVLEEEENDEVAISAQYVTLLEKLETAK
jgi:hypothetical protein